MSLFEILNNLPEFKSDEIIKSFVKGYSIINNRGYENIICSVSGGADSDIMMDLIHRIDVNHKVTYCWFDTGLEYKATKEHLKYLEDRYDVTIRRERAIKPIPVVCKEYGQPFLSKEISEYLNRLQNNNFKFEDKPYEELLKEYPNCKASIRWWCNRKAVNETEDESRFNINHRKYLKEFLIANPPQFKISKMCCQYAKKAVAHKLIKDTNCDLMIIGVRKAEGGVRATAYKNCYTQGENQYRPLFWFKNEDKIIYNQAFAIKNSDCYEKWGYTRTGCVGCPYSLNLLSELSVIRKYEPNMYKAVNNVFKDSYEYTKQYRQFVKKMEDKKKGKIRLFNVYK